MVKKTLKWLWKLRWWNKFFLCLMVGFAYFLSTGIYVAYDPHPEQEECSFNTVSNVEYREILSGMTFNIEKFRNGGSITKNLNVELAKYNGFDEKIATMHAFMRKLGLVHYPSSPVWRINNFQQILKYQRQYTYKGLRANLFRTDLIAILTHEPMTVIITVETDENYEETTVKMGPFYLSSNWIKNGLVRNFDHKNTCPVDFRNTGNEIIFINYDD